MSSDDEDLLNFTVIKNLKSTQKQNEEKIKPTSPLPKISTSAISKSRVSPPKATEWIEKKKKGEPGNFDKPVTPSRARPSSSTKPVIVSVEEELIESPSPKKLEVLHKKPNGSASQPKKFSDQLSPSKPVRARQLFHWVLWVICVYVGQKVPLCQFVSEYSNFQDFLAAQRAAVVFKANHNLRRGSWESW